VGEKFELPVPTLIANDDPVFEELEASHLEWLKGALKKGPEEMIIAIVLRSAAAGALLNGLPKEDFALLAAKTYEVVEKMPVRSVAKKEPEP
jgi:hypothetical protein